jgi:hypothetical protein
VTRWARPRDAGPQINLGLRLRRPRYLPALKSATDTSIAAAESIGANLKDGVGVGSVLDNFVAGALDARSKRRRNGVMTADLVRTAVYNWLRDNPAGGTADEIAAAIGWDRLSVRPRCSELSRAHLIRDSLARHPNASGKNAIVWVLAG